MDVRAGRRRRAGRVGGRGAQGRASRRRRPAAGARLVGARPRGPERRQLLHRAAQPRQEVGRRQHPASRRPSRPAEAVRDGRRVPHQLAAGTPVARPPRRGGHPGRQPAHRLRARPRAGPAGTGGGQGRVRRLVLLRPVGGPQHTHVRRRPLRPHATGGLRGPARGPDHRRRGGSCPVQARAHRRDVGGRHLTAVVRDVGQRPRHRSVEAVRQAGAEDAAYTRCPTRSSTAI